MATSAQADVTASERAAKDAARDQWLRENGWRQVTPESCWDLAWAAAKAHEVWLEDGEEARALEGERRAPLVLDVRITVERLDD